MEGTLGDLVGLIWATVIEFGWLPLCFVLAAYHKRRWATAIAVLGCVYSLVMLIPALCGIGVCFATGRETLVQARWEQVEHILLWLAVPILPALLVSALRWPRSRNRRLLAATVVAICLASASWSMLFMLTPPGEAIHGIPDFVAGRAAAREADRAAVQASENQSAAVAPLSLSDQLSIAVPSFRSAGSGGAVKRVMASMQEQPLVEQSTLANGRAKRWTVDVIGPIARASPAGCEERTITISNGQEVTDMFVCQSDGSLLQARGGCAQPSQLPALFSLDDTTEPWKAWLDGDKVVAAADSAGGAQFRRDYEGSVSSLWLSRDADGRVKWRVSYSNFPSEEQQRSEFVRQQRELKSYTVMLDAASGTVLCSGTCNFSGYSR